MTGPSSGISSPILYRRSFTRHVIHIVEVMFHFACRCTIFYTLDFVFCVVVPYEIKTFTSDVFGAGTDADVFLVLYGRDAICTEQKSLCVNKRERRMYFERGAEDMFIVEVQYHCEAGGVCVFPFVNALCFDVFAARRCGGCN